ncbi:MAG: asparagine synthase-related protein, partial [Thermoproteota archaeon]
NFKVTDSITKLILRQLDRKYLPDNIVNKPKTGFGIPLHEILRTELVDIIDSTLRQDRLNEIGIAGYDFVRCIVDDHMSKKKDLSKKIWCLFTLLKWAEERKAFCEQQ